MSPLEARASLAARRLSPLLPLRPSPLATPPPLPFATRLPPPPTPMAPPYRFRFYPSVLPHGRPKSFQVLTSSKSLASAYHTLPGSHHDLVDSQALAATAHVDTSGADASGPTNAPATDSTSQRGSKRTLPDSSPSQCNSQSPPQSPPCPTTPLCPAAPPHSATLPRSPRWPTTRRRCRLRCRLHCAWWLRRAQRLRRADPR